MPTETIGSCGVGRFPDERKRVLNELELGIAYLRRACPLPDGYSYEVIWHDHESGPYPDIGVVWHAPLPEPSEWIAKAQEELARFDDR